MTVMDKCKAFLLDIFFPNRCPFCGDFIMWDKHICGECEENLKNANDIICRKCGKFGKENCLCGSEKLLYDMVFATFIYNEELVSNAIYRFKKTGEMNIAECAAKDIALHIERENIPVPDIIVPVPMSKRKQRKRGHNQAELLAGCIGKSLDRPVRSDILFKYDTRDEQHLHNAEERQERVKTLFYAGKADLSGMTVMLCDDVMTTGATINECAGLLKQLGAECVISAVCAVTILEKTLSEEDV